MTQLANPTPLPISSEGPAIAGSVKPYQQHLAVCTGGPPELWAARVQEMEGLFAALHMALRARGLHTTIKVTACDAPSTGAEGLDIYLMPDMLVLPEMTVAKVDQLANALQHQFEQGLPFDVEPMPGGDHIFVCVHANRDARCGEWGPQLYSALKREIEAQGAIAYIHQTSHIGGHEFAATCIIYPQGVWYGNLRPDDAARLVERHLNDDQLLPEHYRGRLGASSCQQVAEARAAQAVLELYPQYESLEVDVREGGQQATAVARARVVGAQGPFIIRSEFSLICPRKWWTVDGEPVFASEL